MLNSQKGLGHGARSQFLRDGCALTQGFQGGKLVRPCSMLQLSVDRNILCAFLKPCGLPDGESRVAPGALNADKL